MVDDTPTQAQGGVISQGLEKLFGKNWRTFLASIFLAISLQGDELGLPLRLVRLATTISVVVFGYNAKDKIVTGGTIYQGDTRKVLRQRKLKLATVVAKPGGEKKCS